MAVAMPLAQGHAHSSSTASETRVTEGECTALHRHDYGQRNYVAAAQRLADMQAAGKIRRIGLTNFDVPRVMEMLDAGVPLVSNQVCFVLIIR